ncbi:MAG: 16S rRNA (uracil(1498)-N(3))-methyltransferase [Ignavibacteriae bacterium]|nr:16S rRNA (uracil(1498)-N(3))-methyltransferase [Ignavibacteriota bacterium]
MEYFYTDPNDVHGTHLFLRDEEYKHLARVLQKRVGDHVAVTDGKDRMYEAVIRSLNHTDAECEIVDVKHRVNEPKVDVTIAISVLKNPGRIDFLVEKVTEFGARTIVPMLCERTIPKQEKHTRLEKIALAAMKQCGRSYLPKVFMLTQFDTLVSHAHEYDLKLIPHEKTEQSQFIGAVIKHHPKAKNVLVVVGPEGGFTEHEMELAAENNFVPISLGARRLRSETAAISAVSWIVGGW